jgi:hypothetical protein
MKIHNTGFWECDNISFDFHKHDELLALELSTTLKEMNVSSAIDFGCGYSMYATTLEKNEIPCDCYDGNSNTPALTEGKCDVLDLSEKIILNKTYDCVISLEVGEHIPQKYEKIFIDNLIRHTHKWIIISWALPHQGGHGHVNEQSNEYIEKIFQNVGFIRHQDIEIRLRKSAHWWWFKNTIMVFSHA